MHTQPEHHETIIHSGIAYSYQGLMVIIGTLSITTERVVFTTHRLNFRQFTIAIPLEDIQSVTLKNHLRIFNHGLMITQRNGATDIFAAWRRKRWHMWIKEACLRKKKNV
jgi:hypothetical protein